MLGAWQILRRVAQHLRASASVCPCVCERRRCLRAGSPVTKLILSLFNIIDLVNHSLGASFEIASVYLTFNQQ